MTYGSLFSGIGGMDLGLDRAGWECRWQVEIDPFCRKVLERHWPDVPKYGDITKLTGDELESVDLLCGGFPCQDLSYAGKQAGITGTRSGLWSEFARIIGEIRPRYVLAENVPGLLVPGAMRRVVRDLSRLGYVGIWRCFLASEFGASHLRKRVFLVAYRSIDGCELHTQNGAGGISRYRQPEPSRNGLAHAHEGSQLRQSAVHERRNASGYDVNGRHTDVADAAGQRPALAHVELWPGGDEDADRPGRSGSYVADSERAERRQNDEHIELRSERGEAADRPGRDSPALGAFAPGPNDPRWPAILRARPDLAPALPKICRVDDGAADWLDGAMKDRTKRLSRLGNAVVPQVAEWIGRTLLNSV